MKRMLVVCYLVLGIGFHILAQVNEPEIITTSDGDASNYTSQERGTSYTVESVPNTKKATNSYVSDPDNFLQPSTASEINTLLTALEFRTSDQVALVVLNSIGEAVPKTFATQLFNTWGIGIKGKDNGLLILMIMDQRRVEFETGYGMESMLPDAICKRIQMAYMVPAFKEGNYDKGILEGVKSTCDILENPENSKIAKELNTAMAKEEKITRSSVTTVSGGIYFLVVLIVYFVKRNKKTFKDNFQDKNGDYLAAISQKIWLLLYVFIPLVYVFSMSNFYSGDNFILIFILGNYVMVLLLFVEKRYRLNAALAKKRVEGDYYGNYLQFKKSHERWWVAALFFPLIFIGYVIYVEGEKRKLRNHPRNCKSCKDALVKLTETEDDQYLKGTQLLEENLKSIDYDVWLCRDCGEKEVNSYVNSFSKYSECIQCGVKAYYLFSDRTLVSATYSSSGTGCKTYKCKSCMHEKETRYTIPMKERSSSSSSSGGGSFGGGSSGGGGSGSSW